MKAKNLLRLHQLRTHLDAHTYMPSNLARFLETGQLPNQTPAEKKNSAAASLGSFRARLQQRSSSSSSSSSLPATQRPLAAAPSCGQADAKRPAKTAAQSITPSYSVKDKIDLFNQGLRKENGAPQQQTRAEPAQTSSAIVGKRLHELQAKVKPSAGPSAPKPPTMVTSSHLSLRDRLDRYQAAAGNCKPRLAQGAEQPAAAPPPLPRSAAEARQLKALTHQLLCALPECTDPRLAQISLALRRALQASLDQVDALQ
jgi:hypothetical protein